MHEMAPAPEKHLYWATQYGRASRPRIQSNAMLGLLSLHRRTAVWSYLITRV